MKTVNVTAEIVGTGANLYNVELTPDGWDSNALYLAAGDTPEQAAAAALADLNSDGAIDGCDVEQAVHIIGTFCHG
ncbi:hypothetical protein [Pseudomonas phage UF_RH7]|nr:hypothetical protein [Pseudomonas phage UF_RH7]